MDPMASYAVRREVFLILILSNCRAGGFELPFRIGDIFSESHSGQSKSTSLRIDTKPHQFAVANLDIIVVAGTCIIILDIMIVRDTQHIISY
jgi:hypothetical protein